MSEAFWPIQRGTTAHIDENGDLVSNEIADISRPCYAVVPPHWTTLTTNVRRRWIGKCLLDVFREEFRSKPVAYYRAAILEGFITVNGQKIPEDEIDSIELKDGQRIEHKALVLEYPFPIAHRNDVLSGVTIAGTLLSGKAIAFVKPSGIPTISQGRHDRASLLSLARQTLELDPKNYLHPCHRLDKVTSGLLLCAVDAETSKQISQVLSKPSTAKVYLAQIKGRLKPTIIDDDNTIRRSEDGTITVEAPLGSPPDTLPGQLMRTTTKNPVNSKNAQTEFFEVDYDIESNSTLVLCRPLTGRTHQIRVHLSECLGNPIVGDRLYQDALRESIDGPLHEARIDVNIPLSRWTFDNLPNETVEAADGDRYVPSTVQSVQENDAAVSCAIQMLPRIEFEREEDSVVNTITLHYPIPPVSAIELHAFYYRFTLESTALPTSDASVPAVKRRKFDPSNVSDEIVASIPQWTERFQLDRDTLRSKASKWIDRRLSRGPKDDH